MPCDRAHRLPKRKTSYPGWVRTPIKLTRSPAIDSPPCLWQVGTSWTVWSWATRWRRSFGLGASKGRKVRKWRLSNWRRDIELREGLVGLQKMWSWVLRMSLARLAKETTMVGTQLSFWASWAMEWWGMSVRRWRWLIIGRPGGDDGFSDCELFVG